MSNQVPKLEITEYDRQLIRSRAIDEYTSRSISTGDAFINIIMQFIHDKGFNIVKDETREPTWNQPKASNYTPYTPARTKY